MKIRLDNFSINFFAGDEKGNSIPIIFLHGFTGSSHDWGRIIEILPHNFFPIAIDLTGHGNSDSPNQVDFYTVSWNNKLINEIASHLHIEKFVLCGYSMGARAALNFAINYPEKISKLILESSTAGIESEVDRRVRILSDENLCNLIETKGIDYFVEYWMNLELFSDLKNLDENIYREIVSRKKQNSPKGLINSLKGFGTGVMNPIWNLLPELNIPTLLITGELDKKFTQINGKMNKLIRNSRHEIIKSCGHNVHQKNPKEFADLLINFIS